MKNSTITNTVISAFTSITKWSAYIAVICLFVYTLVDAFHLSMNSMTSGSMFAGLAWLMVISVYSRLSYQLYNLAEESTIFG